MIKYIASDWNKVCWKSDTRCWEPLRLSGELHIPYVQHYSTLAHTGSYGAEPFQPFNTNGLKENKASEHLYYIPSILWEPGRWWESWWETDMEKGKRQKNRTLNGHQDLFLCSLNMHDTLISLLIQGEGDTVHLHCPEELQPANSLPIHRF